MGHDLKECKIFLDRKNMPPPPTSVPQEPRWVDQRRVDSNGDEQMGEINVIFGGSMYITSKMQEKKLQREISLAYRIEPGIRMRWSNVGILLGLEDHPDTELSDRNLPFMIKIPIGRHKVTKTLIDSRASLNLMMRKTFIEMGVNLIELTLVHDTFHGIILGQSSTPIGRIDLEVSCGPRENKRGEMLTFEVASFNIGYNYILGMPFLLKFMAIIHIAYATIKMSGPKGVIILKSDQRDALARENAALTNGRRFGEKEAQELAAKMVKTHGESTSVRTMTPMPPIGGTPRPHAEKKSTFVGFTSNQLIVDRAADDKKKGATDKEVPLDSDDIDKKLRLSTELDAK
jgi:hypothetical protein